MSLQNLTTALYQPSIYMKALSILLYIITICALIYRIYTTLTLNEVLLDIEQTTVKERTDIQNKLMEKESSCYSYIMFSLLFSFISFGFITFLLFSGVDCNFLSIGSAFYILTELMLHISIDRNFKLGQTSIAEDDKEIDRNNQIL